jgi:selenocysteine lyase/cysteine desulfurase
MPTRREFWTQIVTPAAAALAAAELSPAGFARALDALAQTSGDDPARSARDEDLWFEVQQAFTVDRSVINLNNGGVSPAPAVVQDAHKRRLDFSNELPAHNLWQVLEPRKEGVRAGLARLFGCEAEEIAITRNASESLETCQLGIELGRGDEVVTSDQDYPRMLATFDQLERRRGIAVRKIKLPVPCEDAAEIVRRYDAAITPRTRLVLMCHVINLTGQVLPVKAVVRMAREKGVPVVVDGAHSFAHLDFRRDDLDCDYFGTSLHKWLFAPHGTGMLYVRRERIEALWPLMGSNAAMAADVRKFEEIGTHPAAQILSIGEALAFHSGIGPARKEERMRYLRERWAQRLARSERVRFNSSFAREHSCGIGNFRVEGLDTARLQAHLWNDRRILTTLIVHEDFEGLRITPSVYTTLAELDRFGDVVEHAIAHGLPS